MTTIGSLFSGYGGLDMAVEAVTGGTTAWHCDNDPAATKLLAHRYPGVPNLGDITAVDWHSVHPVTILCGGWPCQPFSPAGLQKGADDSRALWPYVLSAVRSLRPAVVVLENVATIASAGELARAAGGLAALGYVGSWERVYASDVGAPHHRPRIFILARRVANTDGSGLEIGRAVRHEAEQPKSLGDLPILADSDGGRRLAGIDDVQAGQPHIAWGGYEPAIRRWERLTRPAPLPWEQGSRGGYRLSPAFSEWMMGLPAGWVTDAPGISRNEQLKLLGNGVVPQQAVAALRHMLAVSEVAA